MVLPLFDYCSLVWDSCGVGSKAYLDKLNRRASCIIERRSIEAVACSRLRDDGGKSFSNKTGEKRAGAGER